ncbi:hypothetical protein BJY04DRAFT_210537 [Aspergillus karnatakaensis]|uniref:Zn(II)2Cys6 transcription factor n=1 Tax=Aspergillus karnatakaensis TaxID=1810916 RepID=UPI003CCCEF04
MKVKKSRVKCDETRPVCLRCSRKGWACAWSLKVVSIPGAIPARIFHTQRETQCFEFFRLHTVGELSGWSGADFWHRLVLQMAHSEPATRRAIIALGALHSDGPSSRHVLRYYGEALTALRHLLCQPDSWACVDVCLTTCLLLSIFDIARKEYTAAQIHYTKGVDILHLHNPAAVSPPPQASPFSPPNTPREIPCYERSLLSHFSHLETNLLCFLNSRPGYQYRPVVVDYNTSLLAIPHQFCSLDEAMESFIRLLHTVQNRTIRARKRLELESPPFLKEIYLHPESHTDNTRHSEFLSDILPQSLASLMSWNDAFERCLYSTPDSWTIPHRRIIVLLRGLWTLLYIRCSRDPALGEMSYDGFLPQFQYAVAQFSNAVDFAWIEKTQSPRPSLRRPLFSLGIGVLSGMYDLLCHCRDSDVRRKGLEILDRMPHQEGLWNGRISRKVIGGIIGVEERDRVSGVVGAEGIEPRKRVVKVDILFHTDKLEVTLDRDGWREVFWVDLDLHLDTDSDPTPS